MVLISVVVIAYNRREFLKEALQSALDQTMQREDYEVILAKNFEDEEIEEYARVNGVKVVHSDARAIGRMTIDAAEHSTGDIVSFLDDDDLFYRWKLEAVSEAMSDGSIGYFHNNVKLFGEGARLKQVRRPSVFRCEKSSVKRLLSLLDNGATFNSSSISVRREVLVRWRGMVEDCSVGPGFTLFFASLMSSKSNALDTRPMTLYRRRLVSNQDRTSTQRRTSLVNGLRKKADAIQAVALASGAGTCTTAARYKLHETRVRLAIYQSMRVGEAETRSIGVLLTAPISYRPLYRFLLAIAAHLLPRIPNSASRKLLESQLL